MIRPSYMMWHPWEVEHTVVKDAAGLDVPVTDMRCPRCGAYRRGSTAWRADGRPSGPCDEEAVRSVLES